MSGIYNEKLWLNLFPFFLYIVLFNKKFEYIKNWNIIYFIKTFMQNKQKNKNKENVITFYR